MLILDRPNAYDRSPAIDDDRSRRMMCSKACAGVRAVPSKPMDPKQFISFVARRPEIRYTAALGSARDFPIRSRGRRRGATSLEACTGPTHAWSTCTEPPRRVPRAPRVPGPPAAAKIYEPNLAPLLSIKPR